MSRKLNEKQRLFAHVEVPEGVGQSKNEAAKPCALCGGRAVKRLYMQAHFPVVCCRGCGLIYADEHFKDEDLRAFYTGDYYQRAYVCHPKEIDAKISASYVDAFRRIDQRQPEGGRVLDFGSARGTFLEALAESPLGRRWRGDGIDINPDEVAMGVEKGIPVRVADIFTDEIPAESYDAVTAFSVLEHMQDPMATLRALRRVLKPGGHLLLIVPNGRCLIVGLGRLAAALFGERARGFSDNVFHEEHLYYFDPRTMPRSLIETGYEPLEHGFAPSYLETHPPGLLVGIGATLLRGLSWVTRRQTMLVAVGRKL